MKKYKVKRLFGFLYIASIVLITGAAISALSEVKQHTSLSVRDSLQTVLNTVQKAHHLIIEERQSTLKAIVTSPDIVKHTQQLIQAYQQNQQVTYTVEPPSAITILNAISSKLARYDNRDFYLISSDRINLSTNFLEQVGERNIIDQLSSQQLDAAFKAENSIIKGIKVPKLGGSHFEPAMFITAAVRDKQHKIIAVLAKFIDPKIHFSHISALGRIGESGETYAFNEHGLLLTDSRFDQHLTNTKQILSGQESVMNIYITDPGGDLLAGYQTDTTNRYRPFTKMAEQAVRGISGYDINGYRDYRGVEVFGVWLWDDVLGMGITTEINKAEALASYEKMRNIFFSLIVFSFIIGFLVLRIIFDLLSRTTKQAQLDNARLADKVAERTKALQQAKDQLTDANTELQLLATTDALTNIANRRRFDDVFAEQWQRSRRQRTSIAIIMVDVDSFKQYNDFYGHQKGDKCLIAIAQALSHSHVARRPGDIIARYGGEEFIILLSDTLLEHVQVAAEQLRNAIESLRIPHKFTQVANQASVTISIGYHYVENVSKTRKAITLDCADKALYQAKLNGRNRIQQYSEEPPNNIANITRVHS